MKFLIKQQLPTKGYIALMSVILLGALSTMIMVSVIYQSTTSAKTDFSLQQSIQARLLANACAEEALQVLLETSTSSATGLLSLNGGSCTYQIQTVQSSRRIDSTGTVGSLIKKVQVVVSTTSPSIVLSSWQDVADF